MERKMNVADFAALVGTTSKTIYQKIDNYDNLPVNEQLRTVKDKVKGREITFIVTDDNQIEYYKNLYGKNTVNEREYYENLTYSNSSSQVNENQNTVNANNNTNISSDAFDKLITLNETYLNRIETVNKELMEYKSRSLLLEDKASREGLYLNEIKGLETENNKLKTYNKWLFTVLVVIITIAATIMIMTITFNKSSQDTVIEPVRQEEVQPVTPPAPAVNKNRPRK